MGTLESVVIAVAVFLGTALLCAFYIPGTKHGSYAALGVGFLVLVPSLLVPLDTINAQWIFGRPLTIPAALAFLLYGLFHLARSYTRNLGKAHH